MGLPGLTNSPNLRMTALNRNACLMGRQAARGDDMTSIREITQVLAVEAIEALDKEIESAIQSALEAGKITPAIVANSGLDGKGKPGGDAGKALNADEARIAAMFGNTAEDLQKYAGR